MKYDGGPAFSRPGSNWQDDGYEYSFGSTYGMSLRDYFAGQALMGFIANPLPGPTTTFEEVVKVGAQLAYGYADAMLAEREKP
jgi:hypothetical protein